MEFEWPRALKLKVIRTGLESHFTNFPSVLLVGKGRESDLLVSGEVPDVALRLRRDKEGFRVLSVEPGFHFQLDGVACHEGLLKMGSILQVGDSCFLVEDEPDTTSINSDSQPRSQKVLAELEKLYRFVGIQTDLQLVLNETLKGLISVLGGTNAFVFTLDSLGKPLLSSGLSEKDRGKDVFSDTVVQESLQSLKTIRVENALVDTRFGGAESVHSLKLRSVMCTPIQIAGKVHGLFYLGSSLPSLSYGEEDQIIFELYATLAGTLLHQLSYINHQRKVIKNLSNSEGTGILAASSSMMRLLEEAETLADTNLNILLLGESGTGKDLLAQFLHRKSARKKQPFMVLNCSTVRGEVLASELFGHRRGYFTGAVADSKGLFLSADGGTLFLDEIGELELPLQATLLRVIESGLVKPLGQSQEEPVDVRILCATNRGLEEMVTKGQFREDLFYRINQHCLRLPPLRERGEDIFLLAYHFLEKVKAQYPHKGIVDFHPDTLAKLAKSAWKGNVRELSNVITKGVLLARTPLVEIDFPDQDIGWDTMAEALRKFQRDYSRKVMAASCGDKEKTIQILDISRSSLFNYLAENRYPNISV